MLETQLAVAHNWNGTAKDVTQGHCQMRQYLTDMLTQQRKKLSSLGSCSLINCPKHAINNSVKPKRNSNHLTYNNLSIDGFKYPNKKLTAKTSYNANACSFLGENGSILERAPRDKSRRRECNLLEKRRRENVRASFNQLRKCITKHIETEKGESSLEHFQYMEPSKRESLKPCYNQLRSYIPRKGEKMSRMDILKTTIAYIRVLKARREARQE
ncbi:hypothetical protein CDAR_491241 [Caerostris darwini]|uniref:BHLH domain-containing protein n=1 Tax=Caerostris darwini TaxID=1538125 RepID=A0AAV4XAG2_9ARAC|nr:hypothetical protein CDAR_491241 [Caerostris darwini]